MADDFSKITAYKHNFYVKGNDICMAFDMKV